MNRKELAKWHREQAEILESGKPIPDYDLTEAKVRELIGQGYTHIATDADGAVYVYGPPQALKTGFYALEANIRDCYTGANWQKSLRTLKEYM